jgi:hypothetical protein
LSRLPPYAIFRIVPRNARQLREEAEKRFPVRVVVKTPPGGFGRAYTEMTAWLDEHCGIGAWEVTPAGTRGIANDALAVYMSNPVCALSFVSRWCLPGNNPPGCYEFRRDEPPRRVPLPTHKTPG